jgi:hypothetical protein
MPNNCGVALIILYIHHSHCIVFTFDLSCFKAWPQGIPMEPFLSDLNKILTRHEEFSQSNKSSVQQLMAKFREFEEIMVGLSRRMEAKFEEFEANLSALSHQMDEMEASFQQLRAPTILQRLVSDSMNHSRPYQPYVVVDNNSVNLDHGTAPMDI